MRHQQLIIMIDIIFVTANMYYKVKNIKSIMITIRVI